MDGKTSPTATITLDDLSRDLAVSQKTIRRMIQSGRIPLPMRLNGNAFRWLQSEIRLWLELGMPSREEFARMKADEVNA